MHRGLCECRSAGFEKIDWSSADGSGAQTVQGLRDRCKGRGVLQSLRRTATYMGTYGGLQSDVTRSYQCIELSSEWIDCESADLRNDS